MGHSKPQPAPKPQGEQSLPETSWDQVLKAIRELAQQPA